MTTINGNTTITQSFGRPVNLKEVVVYRESGYAFDSSNPNWTSELEYNQLFVQATIDYCRIVCANRGHLFLNDALAQFGFRQTRGGQVAGWVYEDGAVDIGSETITQPDGTPRIWITFKPQGTILDRVFDAN